MQSIVAFDVREASDSTVLTGLQEIQRPFCIVKKKKEENLLVGKDKIENTNRKLWKDECNMNYQAN